ncbi:MAG: sensor histidine kinase [Ktedonobacterales bacterium]
MKSFGWASVAQLRWVSATRRKRMAPGNSRFGGARSTPGQLAHLRHRRVRRASTVERAAAGQATAEAQRRQLSSSGSIARDLRTPLSALQAMIEAVADGVVVDPATVRRYQLAMRDAVRRLAALVDEHGARAQLESAARELRREPASIAGIIARALEAARPRAQRLGVTLSAHVDGAMPPVPADAGQIADVLSRLLQNAVRHTPPGGMIVMRAAVAAGADGRDDLLIQVIDTGEGISAERIAHMFASVRQESAAATNPLALAGETRTAGMPIGLGLPLAARVIEAHGGRLWVESPVPADVRRLVAWPASDAPAADGTPGTMVSFTLPR